MSLIGSVDFEVKNFIDLHAFYKDALIKGQNFSI